MPASSVVRADPGWAGIRYRLVFYGGAGTTQVSGPHPRRDIDSPSKLLRSRVGAHD